MKEEKKLQKEEKKLQSEYRHAFEELIRKDNDRISNKELYGQIYAHYKLKISDENFSIKMERITVNKMIGSHKGFRTNAEINMYFIILTLFISTVIQAFASIMQSKVAPIISCFIAFGLFVYFSFDFYKSKWPYKEYVYHMCLHVLDDIEKEKDT